MLENLWSVILEYLPLEKIQSLQISHVSVRTVLAGAFVGLAAYHLLKKRYKLPPGPTPLPLIGNTLSFRGVTLYRKLYEWSKKYGPVITVYLGPIRCVALNNSDVALEALVKKSGDFAGRMQTWSTHNFSEGGKSIALGDYGPLWKLHRRVATKALRHYMTGNQLEQKVHGALDPCIRAIETQKGAFDPYHILSNTIVNMLWGVCFGVNKDLESPEFTQIVETLDLFLEGFENGLFEDIIPPLRLYPTKRYRHLYQQFTIFTDTINIHMREHQETFSADNMRDITDTLLLAQQEEKDNPEMMEDVYIRQALADVFAGGVDTSRITLYWTLLFMAINPEVQARVHEELDSAIDNGEYPLLADKDRLCYTEATLHESMRLGTVVPMGLPHKTVVDTTIGEYQIPQGTMVVINQWALHHDPKHWKQPDRFLPERFLDEEGKMAPKPESWLPFSAGRRNCLGETVARPELLLIFAGLMKKFNFSLEPGVVVDINKVTGGSFASIPQKYKIVATARF